MASDSTPLLQRYWENEDKIRAIEFETGLSFDAIADKPELVTDAVLDQLEALLENREGLLLALATDERQEIATSRVPDLTRFRQLARTVS